MRSGVIVDFGRDAGVVDQDVDAAEMLPTGSDHRRDVIRVADVALQGERLVAGRSQPVGYRLHLVERARREHEVGARARQGLRKLTPSLSQNQGKGSGGCGVWAALRRAAAARPCGTPWGSTCCRSPRA